MQGLQVSNHEILFYKKEEMQGYSAYLGSAERG